MTDDHDKLLEPTPPWSPICGALKKEDDELHICGLRVHGFQDPHGCPCNYVWMGDPSGPDFIRLD